MRSSREREIVNIAANVAIELQLQLISPHYYSLNIKRILISLCFEISNC